MKKYLLGFCLFICVSLCLAEKPNSSDKYSFKLYGLSISESYEYSKRFTNDDPYTLITEISNWRIFHPTLAFQWRTKADNFSEIELTFLEINNDEFLITMVYDDRPYYYPPITTAGTKVTTTNISIRYEYIYNLTKTDNNRFAFSIGASINPYFLKIYEDPALSNQFSTNERNIGAFFHFVPRINFNLSKKLFIDFNVPFCLFNFNHKNVHKNDPILTEELKTQSFVDNTMFPEIYSLRIGIGYRF